MRIKVSTIVFVLVGVVAFVAAWPKVNAHLPRAVDLAPEALAGFYQEDETNFVDGPFGLRFFEDGAVDVFIGEKKIGDPASYIVDHGRIYVTHVCGVWELVPSGDRLYHTEHRSYMSRRGD